VDDAVRVLTAVQPRWYIHRLRVGGKHHAKDGSISSILHLFLALVSLQEQQGEMYTSYLERFVLASCLVEYTSVAAEVSEAEVPKLLSWCSHHHARVATN